MEKSKRREVGRRVSIVLLAINLILFLIKWIPTLFFPSVSLEADAFNSLGDFGYSILFLLGVEVFLRPKDYSHPHGHERFEPFVSLIIAGAIAVTGFLVIREAVLSLMDPSYTFSIFFVAVLLTSAIVKYWLSTYLKDRGQEIDSTAIESSSKDAKVDVIASFSALIGVLGAYSGYLYLDAVLGIVVSGWIFKTAFSIGRKNFQFLTGAAAPQEVIQDIRDILENEKDVLSYHDLEAHYVGPEIHLSVSIHLPEEMSFEKVHDFEDGLKEKLVQVGDIESVYLHLEPKNFEKREE
ncbi:hypothetical protein AKJ52_01135 [candidate division MSBL1 archaeon SCGC-AAA382C18]|uniref:Uncharacterized protein n=1 Tax=candidate division MSBL1 archaeon SCGC-AAA382C18 TaxID=1698281 RepID=A0A133VKV4_9EURY|nr:hypothetical protein AKJ52_01135 [candidate division MSBL1 archaeon SCGC-AAA382C18]